MPMGDIVWPHADRADANIFDIEVVMGVGTEVDTAVDRTAIDIELIYDPFVDSNGCSGVD